MALPVSWAEKLIRKTYTRRGVPRSYRAAVCCTTVRERMYFFLLMKYVLCWVADMSSWRLPDCANNRTKKHIRYPSFDLHVIMEHSPSVTKHYRLISMRKFCLSNARRRMPRMCNDHASLYSEETNAENSAGLVVHLYRIVPHILSTRFPTLYMGKRIAIKILLRKRQFSVRFVSCHARILPIKIFFSFEAMSRYTSIRNKKHFDFCSLILIFAIRLKTFLQMEGAGLLKRKGYFQIWNYSG